MNNVQPQTQHMLYNAVYLFLYAETCERPLEPTASSCSHKEVTLFFREPTCSSYSLDLISFVMCKNALGNIDVKFDTLLLSYYVL